MDGLWQIILNDLRELKRKQFDLHDQFEEAKLQPEIFKLEAMLTALYELKEAKGKIEDIADIIREWNYSDMRLAGEICRIIKVDDAK